MKAPTSIRVTIVVYHIGRFLGALFFCSYFLQTENTWLLIFGIIFLALMIFVTIRNIKQKLYNIKVQETYTLTIDSTRLVMEQNRVKSKEILKSEVDVLKRTKSGTIFIYSKTGEMIEVPLTISKNEELINELLTITSFDSVELPSPIEFEPLEGIGSYIKGIIKDIKLFQITVAMVVIGFIQLAFFYNLAGIEISKYLDTEEVVFSFIDVWLECLVIIVFVGSLHWISKSVYLNFKPKVKTLINYIPLIFVSVVSVGIIYFMYDVIMTGEIKEGMTSTEVYGQQLRSFVLCMAISIQMTFLIALVPLLPLTFGETRVPLSSGSSVIVAGLVVFLVITSIESYLRYNYTLGGYPKYEVHLTRSNESEFHTNDTSVYIGRTKNYYFFKNPETGINKVISRGSVSGERMIEIRSGF